MKLTETVDGQRRFRSDPPLLIPVPDARVRRGRRAGSGRSTRSTCAPCRPDRIALLAKYSFVDLAHKVVGVGSVGTRALVLLLESGDGEPLLLQVKQANPSVLEPYLGASQFDNAGKRVVVGQRVHAGRGDPFLGWTRGSAQTPHDFYVRQLQGHEGLHRRRAPRQGRADRSTARSAGPCWPGRTPGPETRRSITRLPRRHRRVRPRRGRLQHGLRAASTPTTTRRSSPASSEPDGVRPGRPAAAAALVFLEGSEPPTGGHWRAHVDIGHGPWRRVAAALERLRRGSPCRPSSGRRALPSGWILAQPRGGDRGRDAGGRAGCRQ